MSAVNQDSQVRETAEGTEIVLEDLVDGDPVIELTDLVLETETEQGAPSADEESQPAVEKNSIMELTDQIDDAGQAAEDMLSLEEDDSDPFEEGEAERENVRQDPELEVDPFEEEERLAPPVNMVHARREDTSQTMAFASPAGPEQPLADVTGLQVESIAIMDYAAKLQALGKELTKLSAIVEESEQIRKTQSVSFVEHLERLAKAVSATGADDQQNAASPVTDSEKGNAPVELAQVTGAGRTDADLQTKVDQAVAYYESRVDQAVANNEARFSEVASRLDALEARPQPDVETALAALEERLQNDMAQIAHDAASRIAVTESGLADVVKRVADINPRTLPDLADVAAMVEERLRPGMNQSAASAASRFSEFGARFSAIESRLADLEAHFGGTEGRIAASESGLADMGMRLAGVESRFLPDIGAITSSVENRLQMQTNQILSAVEERLKNIETRLAALEMRPLPDTETIANLVIERLRESMNQMAARSAATVIREELERVVAETDR